MRRFASIVFAVSCAPLVLQSVWHATPARATFPGTNGRIAFSEIPSAFGGPWIDLVNPDGTGLGAAFCPNYFNPYCWDAAWSSDGKTLALDVQDVGYGPAHIAVERPNGSGFRVVAGRNTRSPAWSPSGQRIVYTKSMGNQTTDLFIRNLVTGTVKQLTFSHNGVANEFPDWSPDATRIVFSGRVGGNWRLYGMTLAGREITRLTTDTLAPSHPNCSPDETKVLFSGSDGYLHVLTMSTRQVESLIAGGEGAWSPDGTMVVYTHFNLVSVLPLGGDPIAIVSSEDDDFADPSWQAIG